MPGQEIPTLPLAMLRPWTWPGHACHNYALLTLRYSDMTQRPFTILGIQQIAIGAPSKERLKALWVDMLGLEVTGNYVSERENVDEDICAMGSGPFKVEVDLMQPLDADKKPAVHSTPLNHVGLWVDDLPVAVE